MNQTRYYVRVGITLVVGAILLAMGLAFLRGTLTDQRTVGFNVEFDDARGITEGAPVQMAGVQIGRVERVSLTRQNRARLRLRVERRYPIPQGASFTISSALLGGSAVLRVDPEPGTPGTEIPANATISGDVSPGLDTALAKSERLLESFQKTASAVERLATDPRTQRNLTETLQNVRVATAGLPRLQRDVQAQLRLLSGQTRGLLTTLEGAAASGQAVTVNAGRLTSELRAVLAENRSSLKSLLQSADETASAFAGLAEQAGAALGNKELQQNLVAATGNLRAISARLVTVAGNVERLSSDPRLSADIRETASNLRETSASVRSLAARIEAIRLPGERRPGGGTPSPTPARRTLSEPGGVVDAGYDAAAERLRLDANFTLLRPEGRFLRAGVYDLTESNRLNLQIGRQEGDRVFRYGLFAGKLGVGLDARTGPLDLRLDVFDPNRLSVNVRAKARVSDTTSGFFGVDSLGNGNRAVLGVQIRR
jgi:phospholipid/cholesterol/gamma-HCH transport system substrate-binding protein